MPGCREPGFGTTPAKLMNKESFLAAKEGHGSSNVPNTSSLPPFRWKAEHKRPRARPSGRLCALKQAQQYWGEPPDWAGAVPAEQHHGTAGCVEAAPPRGARGPSGRLPPLLRHWMFLRWSCLLHGQGQLEIPCCDRGGITHSQGGNHWHIFP